MSLSTTSSPARSASWIDTSHCLHLTPSATSHHVHHCTTCESSLYILCTEQSFPALLYHRASLQSFPLLLPTITLHFPAFPFNPLSRRLALHSATHRLNCSMVGAINIKSSSYTNSKGRPVIASLETRVDSVLTLHANQPSCQNSLCSPSVLTTVEAPIYNAITVLPQSPSPTSLETLSNAFSKSTKA